MIRYIGNPDWKGLQVMRRPLFILLFLVTCFALPGCKSGSGLFSGGLMSGLSFGSGAPGGQTEPDLVFDKSNPETE